MSVIVKGMKMPKNCDECPILCEYRFCALTDDHASSIGWKLDEKRMPNCPLTEFRDCRTVRSPIVYTSYVKSAKAIIPAERSEE